MSYYDIICSYCGKRYGAHYGRSCPDGAGTSFVPFGINEDTTLCDHCGKTIKEHSSHMYCNDMNTVFKKMTNPLPDELFDI